MPTATTLSVIIAVLALFNDVFGIRTMAVGVYCRVVDECAGGKGRPSGVGGDTSSAAPENPKPGIPTACRGKDNLLIEGALVNPCIRREGDSLEIYVDVEPGSPDDPNEVVVWAWWRDAENAKGEPHKCLIKLGDGYQRCGPFTANPPRAGYYSAATTVTSSGEVPAKWADKNSTGQVSARIYWPGKQ
ncbi:hypothetical protein IMZ11_15665 [Microtetraspora sp. AC03309]|uniref:hypothetical protein n=1 Tax=Microtetraspora sp. AC03309 TaxID=2779376 RepID=UPI001E64896E|nr:hypothetical protein [Microtetraspora sp. AC03309]MCC5577063.1 hypothetical protein [Microtetraspora sp. AC03309]